MWQKICQWIDRWRMRRMVESLTRMPERKLRAIWLLTWEEVDGCRTITVLPASRGALRRSGSRASALAEEIGVFRPAPQRCGCRDRSERRVPTHIEFSNLIGDRHAITRLYWRLTDISRPSRLILYRSGRRDYDFIYASHLSHYESLPHDLIVSPRLSLTGYPGQPPCHEN